MTVLPLPCNAAEPTPQAATIGVVVPYDMAMDRELRRFSEDEAGREQLDLLFTRTPFEPLAVSAEQARAISRPELIAEAVRSVSAVAPAGYVYGCTSGSFIHGLAGERRLTQAMSAAGRDSAVEAAAAVESVGTAGGPSGIGEDASALTTSGALLAAAQALGATRIAVATPYNEVIAALFAQFFAEAGIELVGTSNLNLSGRIWTVDPQRTYELIRNADTPDAEAILVACTNLPTFEVLDRLEQHLGKPVISANQATIWAALQAFGLPYVGPGARLRDLAPLARIPEEARL